MKQPIKHYPNAIPKSEIARLIGNKPNPVVLEIGANDGQDSAEMFKAIPGVRLHCFEPDPRPIKRFNERFDEVDFPIGVDVELHQTAIGDRDGTTTLYMSGGKAGHMEDWDLSSSIQKPGLHRVRSPEINFDRSMDVKVTRLDTWAADWLPLDAVIDFIWCDIQGGQAGLYRGGVETLKRTRYMLQEFYQRPLYDGEPNLQEQFQMLGPDWELVAFYQSENFLARNRRFS